MKLPLLRGRHSLAIISFILLSSLVGKQVFAEPGGPAPTALASVTASNTGPLTCKTKTVMLNGTPAPAAGVTYTWQGTGTVASFTATGASVAVTKPGTYILTATELSTGLTSTSSTTVVQVLTVPTGVTATHVGELGCTNNMVPMSGNSTTALGVTYVWVYDDGLFLASGQTATATAPGTYIVIATYTPTGCTASATTTVSRIFTAPGSLTAQASGSLTCKDASVTLAGSSNISSASYTWAGPNGFTASGPSVTATAIGTYTMTAANGSNAFGCTSSTTVSVTQDLSAPASVTAAASDLLTCANTSVTLTGSSGSGATYTWAGPSGFTASGATATTSTVGTYTVTATNPSTGCTATASTTVSQNTTVPTGLTMTAIPRNAQVTCTNNSVNFTADANTPNLTYSWTGPNGPIATANAITATSAGTYTLTGTDPTNGCAATASTVVTQNITAPGGVVTTADPVTAQITCTHGTVVLTGSSTTTGVTYGWSGPGIVSTTGGSATVNTPGTYTFSATDPTNGCVATLSGTVTKNINAPVGLSASPGDVISCFSPAIDLHGGSSTPNAIFLWSGPGGYTANTADAETSVPGNYTLTVTNPANGCSAQLSTIVLVDTATPVGVTASNNGPLNCNMPNVTITSSSSTTGVDFTWVTPANAFITGATAVVTAPGTYTIVVTNNGNGCATQATTTVIQNTTGCSGSNAASPGAVSGRAMQDLTGDAVTGFVYRAYPNPFSTTAFIEFASSVSSPVKVEIYSSYGYREKLLFNNTVNANQVYKLQLGAEGLSSGTHFCVISNNGKVYSTKLVMIR